MSGPRVVPVHQGPALPVLSDPSQTEAFLAAGSEGPSLVDCTSFEVMRRRAIATAFAFDRHFEAAGFAVLGSEG
jgi:predicted nucleic acid-binding protein